MDILFKRFDTDMDGELSLKDFEKLLKHLGIGSKYSKAQRERIARHISKATPEEIISMNYRDFVAALKGKP